MTTTLRKMPHSRRQRIKGEIMDILWEPDPIHGGLLYRPFSPFNANERMQIQQVVSISFHDLVARTIREEITPELEFCSKTLDCETCGKQFKTFGSNYVCVDCETNHSIISVMESLIYGVANCQTIESRLMDLPKNVHLGRRQVTHFIRLNLENLVKEHWGTDNLVTFKAITVPAKL